MTQTDVLSFVKSLLIKYLLLGEWQGEETKQQMLLRRIQPSQTQSLLLCFSMEIWMLKTNILGVTAFQLSFFLIFLIIQSSTYITNKFIFRNIDLNHLLATVAKLFSESSLIKLKLSLKSRLFDFSPNLETLLWLFLLFVPENKSMQFVYHVCWWGIDIFQNARYICKRAHASKISIGFIRKEIDEIVRKALQLSTEISILIGNKSLWIRSDLSLRLENIVLFLATETNIIINQLQFNSRPY